MAGGTVPVGRPARPAGPAVPLRSSAMELPDFHIPHAEKIEWMIETEGWAIEPVPPRPDVDPPVAGYAYSIGLPAHVGFPEVAVFGLTPVAARGLIGLVVDLCRGGTEIPVGDELVGLLDNELRCRFAPVDAEAWGALFVTGTSWYRGEPFELVQLLYPDRNGFLPYEAGYEQRMRLAQPVVGTGSDEPGHDCRPRWCVLGRISSGPDAGPGNLGERPKVPLRPTGGMWPAAIRQPGVGRREPATMAAGERGPSATCCR